MIYSCQLKVGFRFLDLLVNGLDVPGKVIRVQRQRYDQVAQRISQWGSPPIDTTNGLINMVL